MTSLILKKLTVRKAPGFPEGMKPVEGLANHINIIAGPNASGKSTTARMIQKLVWRNETQGHVLEGSFDAEGTPWEVKIDSGYSLVQRNGIGAEFTGLPDAFSADRYYLALHELITHDEEELAAELIRQSIGGFDLDEAAENLKYGAAIKGVRIAEFRELERASQAYTDALETQLSLQGEQEELANLYEQRAIAENAAVRKGLYEEVVAYIQLKQAHETLTNELANFPHEIKNFSGGETKFFRELEEEIEEAKNAFNELNRNIEVAQQELHQLSLPEEGISQESIDELEESIQTITDREREIKIKQGDLQEAVAARESALLNIESIDPEVWQHLDVGEVQVLDRWLQETFQVMAEKEALETQIKALKERTQTNKNIRSAEKLLEGISYLGRWLKAPSESRALPLLPVILIAIFGLIAVFASGWMQIAMGAGIVLLLLLVILKYGNSGSQKMLLLRQQDFEQTGLPTPEGWTVESVATLIGQFTTELKESYEVEKAKDELNRCSNALGGVLQRHARLTAEREQFLTRNGAAPELPANLLENSGTLYWFMQAVKKWQEASAKVGEIQASLGVLSQQQEEALNRANQLFQAAGFQTTDTAALARARFSELKRQHDRRTELIRTIRQKQSMCQDKTERCRRAERRITEKYRELGILAGDRQQVTDIEQQLATYKEVSQEHFASQRELDAIGGRIRSHSMYSEVEETLDSTSLDQAESERDGLESIAAELTAINQKITRIETRVEEATKGRVLEEKLAEKEAAKEKLKGVFEDNLSLITGNILTEQLRNQNQQQNQPQVFRRANEIFNRITNGRYELRLDDHFVAFDTKNSIGQSLSEISTGTRVQLLMAVRLAWVESNERGWKLPILADELLANSDEERAAAIIESLIEISREGRQVFYFTAQADEVHKWQTYLDRQEEVTNHIVLLSDAAGTTINPADRPQFALLSAVPEPNDGEAYDRYVLRIGVQPFNILTHTCAQLPIWFLMDDPRLLHECLSRRINSWGQLESFRIHGGRLHGLSDDFFTGMSEKIELLERFRELYLRDRHMPIDRSVLEESGWITDNFIDAVSEKLSELNGDPVMLIEALRAGEIPRFRRAYADDLEEYLIEEGFISEEDPMTEEQILIAIHAVISRFEDESAARDFIERVLRGTVEMVPL